jgi:hypothetical protein
LGIRNFKMKLLKNINKRDNGFTLVELQIASFIALITLTALFSLYIFVWRNFNIGNTFLDVYANSRNASSLLMRDIRSATQVASSYGSYTTTDHSIVLMIPSIDAQKEIINSKYDYVIYKLQGNDIYRIVQVDPSSSRQNENRVIANYCSSLTFSSGGVTLSNIANLSTVNNIAIYLPINKSTISLGGTGTVIESINPTTLVRLRNK